MISSSSTYLILGEKVFLLLLILLLIAPILPSFIIKPPLSFSLTHHRVMMPFKPFDICALLMIKKTKGDKFASKSRKYVFVGHQYGKKGWPLFDLDSKEFFVSRDVNFFE